MLDSFLVEALQIRPWRIDAWSPIARAEISEDSVTWKTVTGSRLTLSANFFGLFLYARVVVAPEAGLEWADLETNQNVLMPGDQLGRLNRNTGQTWIGRFEEEGRPAAVALVAAPTGLQIAGWYKDPDGTNVPRLVSDPLPWEQVESVLPAGPSILLTEWAPIIGQGLGPA